MTDLEITKLCAEAMGEVVSEYEGYFFFAGSAYPAAQRNTHYNPLVNDAQTMALVKKFLLPVGYNGGWGCVKLDKDGMLICGAYHYPSLNRAVCVVVAEMQSRSSTPTHPNQGKK